jgi:hypothetical protein
MNNQDQTSDERSELNDSVRELFSKDLDVELIAINKDVNVPWECPCDMCASQD